MKNKWMTMVAAIVVLVIWGIIVYRLFFQTKQTEMRSEPAVPVIVSPLKESVIRYSLIGEYRDPFLGVSERNTPKQPRDNTTKQRLEVKSIAKHKEQIHPRWPKIVYNGLITRNGNATHLFMSINGADQIVNPKDTIDEVQVVHYDKDSIEVKFYEETKTIHRHH